MGKYKHSKITPQMEDEDSYSWLSRIVTTLPDMIYNQKLKKVIQDLPVYYGNWLHSLQKDCKN